MRAYVTCANNKTYEFKIDNMEAFEVFTNMFEGCSQYNDEYFQAIDIDPIKLKAVDETGKTIYENNYYTFLRNYYLKRP